MRLSEVRIKNFKGISEIKFSIPRTDSEKPGSGEFVSIVGENNTGKSSILQALQLALPKTDIGRPNINHFPEREVENGPIEVEFTFVDVTEDDRTRQGVRTHVYDDEFRLKKVWDSPRTQPTYFAYHPQRDWPEWLGKRKKSTLIEAADEAGDEEAQELIDLYEDQADEELEWLNNEIRSELRHIAIRENMGFVEETTPEWQENPGGISSNVDSVLPRVIKIPAITRPQEEIETGRKSSSTSQIIQRIFDERLSERDVVQSLKEKGEQVKELFEGEEKDEAIEEFEEQISDKVGRMIDIEASIDFEPPDVTSDLTGQTSLKTVHEGVKTEPHHQGHGAQRALVLSLLEILSDERNETEGDYNRPLILMIEEPEIYMHPQMLRSMKDVLLSIARSEKAQVICTTHSPVFLNLADRHEGIVILQKEEGEVESFQRQEELFPPDTAEKSRRRLRMILSFDPTVNEVFFSDRVCLVEGDTEMAVLEAIAQRLSEDDRIDYEKYLERRRNVTLVNCRGKTTIFSFQRVLNGFGIEYDVVHDLDDSGPEEGHNETIRELKSASTDIHTHNPNLEGEFFGEEPNQNKPWWATKKIKEEGVPPEAEDYFEFVLNQDLGDLS